MARFKLLIEYAGTKYSGWQIQKNARTVAGEIERAVLEATGRREFELYGSGRTDAGVHAVAQVAHLDMYTDLAPELLRRKINDELPADIHIRAVTRTPHKFHARHDAIERSYIYQISTRRTAFGKPYVWWIREPLSVEAMREAAAAFVGLQNFEALTADDPDDKSTKVLVDAVEIQQSGALILIRVRGSHFLWKMVRRMVGVLAAVGRGEIPAARAAQFLEPSVRMDAKSTAAALAAPAAGLFLEAVRYPGDPAFGPLKPVLMIE
ncbi:MAG TPA: tRNA pseudouridine(38-40) synthase TruA [Vicinamibacterales bacterium]|nr:tRNA pseudouridine(38-40) synthase TruA [Vicinamibacterales bacterium]